MYVLILVTTLLMLLGIVSTTRFELFLGSMAIRNSYEAYMQEDERQYYNKKEFDKYDKPPKKQAAPGQPQPDEDEQQAKSPKPIAKLNISPLIEGAGSFSQEYRDFVKATFLRLIRENYDIPKIFKEVTVEDFVNAFKEETKRKICGKSITKVDQLEGLAFQNPRMREIFYELIRDKDRGKGKDQAPPLLSLLAMRQSPVAIRVFLAPRALLLALYANAAVVDQVIEYRKNPWGSFTVTSEGLEATVNADAEGNDAQLVPDDKNAIKQASELFKNQGFNAQRTADARDAFLDFTVSGTAPPK